MGPFFSKLQKVSSKYYKYESEIGRDHILKTVKLIFKWKQEAERKKLIVQRQRHNSGVTSYILYQSAAVRYLHRRTYLDNDLNDFYFLTASVRNRKQKQNKTVNRSN